MFWGLRTREVVSAITIPAIAIGGISAENPDRPRRRSTGRSRQAQWWEVKTFQLPSDGW
ncbi:hypothetical protein MASR2M79_19070 [Aminivibrio sp.]